MSDGNSEFPLQPSSDLLDHDKSNATVPVELESSAMNSELEEVEFDSRGGIHVTQKGRVVKLEYGDMKTHLIDVTNSIEPNSKEGKMVREMYDDFSDEEFDNFYASNNGVVLVVSRFLDPDVKKKIFIGSLGEMKPKEDGFGYFPIIEILKQARFEDRERSEFVPYSFNSSMADRYMLEEIRNAFSEVKSDPSNPVLPDSSVVEAKFEVK